MRALFGTDGIRGEAGAWPLDGLTVRAIGRALAGALGGGARPSVVVGRDTRESGPRLLGDLCSGLVAGGARVRSAGVLPTPGVAYLARHGGFDAGVVLSASHNAHSDNGIKVFGPAGLKLDDALERRIERDVETLAAGGDVPSATPPPDEPALQRAHADWLVERGRAIGAGGPLSLVVDCANGAASGIAADVLRRLGADVHAVFDAPDGRNINAGCGSLHLEPLAAAVRARRADMGVAFDGDADRALFVDHAGAPVDGDQVLLLLASWLQRRGGFRGPHVVGTVMSNFGLERALADLGVGLARERVGDRHVLQRMAADGCNLGGEPSGHVILLDEAPTGDGILTALHVLAAVRSSGRPLADLAGALSRSPQALRNVRVKERVPLERVDGYDRLLEGWSERLARDGRIVVRYSGTESIVRVMVEGVDAGLVERCADELAGHLSRHLGPAA